MMIAQPMLIQNTKGHLRQSLTMTPNCGLLALQKPQSYAKGDAQSNSIHCRSAANQDLSSKQLSGGFCMVHGECLLSQGREDRFARCIRMRM